MNLNDAIIKRIEEICKKIAISATSPCEVECLRQQFMTFLKAEQNAPQ